MTARQRLPVALALSLVVTSRSFQPVPLVRLPSKLVPVSEPNLPTILQHVPTKHPHRSVTTNALAMSKANSELDIEAERRKILTMLGYRVSSLLYMGLGVVLIAWKLIQAPAQLPLTCYVAAGPMLAAGVSYVMEGAAVNERLHTDTSKRLNLSLGLYGVLWLCSAFLIRNTPSKIVTNPLVLGASIITGVNSFKAWAYGATKGKKNHSEKNLVNDLFSTIAKSTGILFTKIKSLSSFVYLCAALMVGGLNISEALSGYKVLSGGNPSVILLSKKIFRFSFYSTLFAVLLSLKDGADRNVLTASTLIELQVLATCSLGVLGVYFYDLGSIAFGAFSIFFSFFSATICYNAVKVKNGQQNRSVALSR